MDANDLAAADQLDKTRSGLLAGRDLIARLSTWPWSAGVLRGFASAVLLPDGLWLLMRVLERAV